MSHQHLSHPLQDMHTRTAHRKLQSVSPGPDTLSSYSSITPAITYPRTVSSSAPGNRIWTFSVQSKAFWLVSKQLLTTKHRFSNPFKVGPTNWLISWVKHRTPLQATSPIIYQHCPSLSLTSSCSLIRNRSFQTQNLFLAQRGNATLMRILWHLVISRFSRCCTDQLQWSVP